MIEIIREKGEDLTDDEKIRSPLFRNLPQAKVLKMLGVNRLTNMDIVGELGAKISTIIDDPSQIEIRRLILDKKTDEAAQLICEELKKGELAIS